MIFMVDSFCFASVCSVTVTHLVPVHFYIAYRTYICVYACIHKHMRARAVGVLRAFTLGKYLLAAENVYRTVYYAF